MKFGQVLLILSIIICFGMSVSADPPNDVNIEGLTGKVKRFEEEFSDMQLRDGVLKETSRHHLRTLIFDKQGRRTYEQSGDVNSFEKYYSYEKEKCFVRTVNTRLDFSSGKPSESFSLHVFNYVAGENSVYREVFIGRPPAFDTKTQKYKYVFDSNNRLLEELMYSAADVPVVRRKYVYTDQSLPTEAQISLVRGSRPQTFKYTYVVDAQGNWTKRTEEITLADAGSTKRVKVTYRKIEYYK